jgi:hypothetical protein
MKALPGRPPARMSRILRPGALIRPGGWYPGILIRAGLTGYGPEPTLATQTLAKRVITDICAAGDMTFTSRMILMTLSR